MSGERRSLYRLPNEGKIAGVCAGLARYFGLETWVVRIIALSFLLFSSGTAVLVYCVAVWIMDVEPGAEYADSGCCWSGTSGSSDTKNNEPKVKDVWSRHWGPRAALKNIHKTVSELDMRLQAMERYVTSSHFHLDREFRRMSES